MGVTYLGGDGRMIKDIVLLRQATKRSLNLERSMFRFSCVFSSSFPHSPSPDLAQMVGIKFYLLLGEICHRGSENPIFDAVQ